MGLAINVYVKEVDDFLIPQWTSQLSELGMSCEIDPRFSFRGHSGYIQFKVTPTDCPKRRFNERAFLTGCWLDLEDFSLNGSIEALKPKKTWWRKLLYPTEKEIFFVNREIDQRLKDCKKKLIFTWLNFDSFDVRIAYLSSAVLTQLTHGVCSYPDDDYWFENHNLIEHARNQVLEYEEAVSDKRWNVQPFRKWRKRGI